MSKKTFTPLVDGALITATPLNNNFDNLELVINSVSNNQFHKEGLDWDVNNQLVSGTGVAGTTGYNPVLSCVKTSAGSIPSGSSTTFAGSATPTVVTDGTDDFQITFTPATDSPTYAIVVGDCVRYWFGASVICYNDDGGTMLEAINDRMIFYPQFRFTVGTTVGAWLDAWPTPVSSDFIGPVAQVGAAVQGLAVLYMTTRTSAGAGRGPGSWRSIHLEGLCPVTVSNVTKIEIRIVAYSAGTNLLTLKTDLNNANMQGVLLKQAYTV